VKRLTTICCICLALLFSIPCTFAWSSAGHQVIAAEAYRLLPPNLQKRVTEILKAHPDYQKWQASFTADNPSLDSATFIFMRSSTWPDEIRRVGGQYDHPKWHYVDYPLKPAKFPVEPGPDPADDILYGIARCEKTLSGRKATAEERAVHLSWLIHLIGDLHQPLHCSSLVTGVYPEGDKGGNFFYIKPASRGISLHSFWDGLLGTSGKPGAHFNYAIQNEAEHPKKTLKELRKAKTPKKWSLESRAIAVEKAYLHGGLKGGTDRETAVELPEGYTKAAKVVAERQAALAGYRLAAEIQKWVR
jgi:S1/P1 Nuclease